MGKTLELDVMKALTSSLSSTSTSLSTLVGTREDQLKPILMRLERLGFVQSSHDSIADIDHYSPTLKGFVWLREFKPSTSYILASRETKDDSRAPRDVIIAAAVDRSIDDIGLSVRTVNSLKNEGIRTLGDLVQYREEELLKGKNVGEKALGEIAELLRREGLNFGMKFEEAGGQSIIGEEDTLPLSPMGEGSEE